MSDEERAQTSQPSRREDLRMRMFVANLAWTTTEDELERLFAPYGMVHRTRIVTDRETGRSHGCGFVEMPDDTAAQAAIEGLNGTALGGR
jgi:RNA recognition motif-containing protein